MVRQPGPVSHTISELKRSLAEADAALQALSALGMGVGDDQREIKSALDQAIHQIGLSRSAVVQLTKSIDGKISGRSSTKRSLANLDLEAEIERQRLLAVMEALPVGVSILDARGGNIKGNRAFEELWGSPRPAVEGVNGYEGYKAWWEDTGELVQPEEWASAQAVRLGKSVTGQLVKIQRFDGSFAHVLNSAAPIFDQEGEITGCAVAIQDVSELKYREDDIRRLNQTLKALSSSNQAMLRAANEQDYLNEVCRIIVEDCGFAMVWIGFLQDDECKSVKPAASAGFDKGYLEALNISLADPKRGRGPTGTAIRTAKPARCNNMLTDPHFAPWRKAALERGFASSIVLPLVSDGVVFGAINIYSREPDGFSDEEENLLVELTSDLAYGISTFRLKVQTARTVEALRLSEERYRNLFNTTSDGIWIHNMAGVIQEANDAYCAMSGYTHEELTGMPISVLEANENPAEIANHIQKLILQGGHDSFESRHKRKDGTIFDVDITASYLAEKEGGRIAIFVRDVTQRKCLEAELSQIEVQRQVARAIEVERQRFYDVLETLPVMICLLTLDYQVAFANRLFRTTFGESEGRHCYQYCYASEKPCDFCESYSVFQTGLPHHWEINTADGRVIDVYDAPFSDVDGTPMILEMDIDITERRRSEQELAQYRQQLEEMVRERTARLEAANTRLAYLATFPEDNPRPIVEVNLDGKVTYANRSAQILFPELIDTGKAHPWLVGWQSVADRFIRGPAEILVRDVAIGDRYFQQSINYLSTQGLLRIYGLDITERKLADEALRRARDELELRVQERTQELNIANEQLRAEIADREKAQIELESSLQELQVIEEELRNNNEMLLDAQKILDSERQRYRDLFEFAPDAYLVTDSNGCILEANQFSTRLFQIRHRSLIGKPLIVFLHQADHAAFSHLLLALNRDKVIQSQELRLIPRKGPEIIASVKVALGDEQGKKYSLRWTIRDITQRKQAEEIIRQNALRTAVLSEVTQSLAGASLDEKTILDVVANTSARLIGDGCIITMLSSDGKWLQPVAWHHKNPTALERMGKLYSSLHLSPKTSFSGRVFQSSQSMLLKEISPQDIKASIPSEFQKYVDDVGISSLLVVPLQLGSTTIGTIGVTRDTGGQPYTEDDQSLMEILSSRIGQAIHNARLYQELQSALRKEVETHDQLVQSEKFAAVGRLLASITHEINNPLQTIKNCLYLSQMDSQPGTPLADALAIASTETNRLSNLVAQLREIYRPPTQGLGKPVTLPTLVDEVQILLSSYMQDKHVRWEVIPPEIDLFSGLVVEGVPDQLKQVFLNICLNAIDAMEPKGGALKIRFLADLTAKQVGVCFTDTGPGLPSEVKSKLFEPFTTTKEKGLGLGLVICYDIIKRHEGHIDVESEPGKGAAFTVWLPARRE